MLFIAPFVSKGTLHSRTDDVCKIIEYQKNYRTPPPTPHTQTMKWDLFNLVFILCLRVVSSDLSRDLHLSGRLFKEAAVFLPQCRQAVAYSTAIFTFPSPLSLLHLLSFHICFLFSFLSCPLSADGQIWESSELRRRRSVFHRVWKCYGARSTRGQITIYNVLWDCGTNQVGMDRKTSINAL